MCGDAVYIISEESRLEECLEEDASVVSGVLEADFLLLEAVVVMVRSWWCWCPLYRREHCCRSLQQKILFYLFYRLFLFFWLRKQPNKS